MIDMPVEAIVWRLGMFGLPAVFALASVVLGLVKTGDARRRVFAATLIGAWVAPMLVLILSGVTRVHGPDPSFRGLFFVTPLLLALYAIGLWIGEKTR